MKSKQSRRILSLLLTALLFATFIFPSAASAAKKPAVKTINVTVGETTQLDLALTPTADGSLPVVSANSSDDSVATVDNTGLVTAVSIGKAKITFKIDKKTLTMIVNVIPKYVQYSDGQISIDYPETWTKAVDDEDMTVSFESTGQYANELYPGKVSVLIGDMYEGFWTWDILKQASIDSIKKEFKGKVKEAKMIKFAGNDALLITYTLKKLGISFKVMQVLTVTNKNTVLLLYMATEKDYNQSGDNIMRIVNSVKILR